MCCLSLSRSVCLLCDDRCPCSSVSHRRVVCQFNLFIRPNGTPGYKPTQRLDTKGWKVRNSFFSEMFGRWQKEIYYSPSRSIRCWLSAIVIQLTKYLPALCIHLLIDLSVSVSLSLSIIPQSTPVTRLISKEQQRRRQCL